MNLSQPFYDIANTSIIGGPLFHVVVRIDDEDVRRTSRIAEEAAGGELV